jgi:DNA-binding winged helix-turn-helix (wHTH) protein
MRFSFGEYELDTEARTLLRAGKRIRVQAKVLDLLAYLIEHRERVGIRLSRRPIAQDRLCG